VSIATLSDWNKINRCFQYVLQTAHFGILINCKPPQKGNNTLSQWADASFGVHADGRGQQCVATNFNGNWIYFSSRILRCHALSSTEAEYEVITEAQNLNEWFMGLFQELGLKFATPSIHNDNKSAIHLTSRPIAFGRSKHALIKYEYVRSCVRSGSVIISYIPTGDMVADLGTKPLQGSVFSKFRNTLVCGNSSLKISSLKSTSSPSRGHVVK
jgi:hypothetical protein